MARRVRFRGRRLEATVKQSEIYRQNAENCAYLAEEAPNEPTRQRYKRMEAAWRSLADEQDWLDGEPSPVRKGDERF
jgi:hypothetical protein